MAKRSISAFLAISALALVAVIGTVTYRSVSAQSTTPTDPAPTGSEDRPGRLPSGRHGGYNQEQLAAALNVDVETLQAAVDAANQAALEQAVDQGLITQEQADASLANRLAGRGLGKFRGLSASGIDYDVLLAEALGISVDDLTTAKHEAFKVAIDNAVLDNKLSQEEANLLKGQNALYNSEKFQTTMQSAFEAAVNQAVADGTITQEQADQILASHSGVPGFNQGGPGRHGGRHGEVPPASPNSPSGETPSPETGSGL